MVWVYSVGYFLLSLLAIIRNPDVQRRIIEVSDTQYKVVCYLGSWANYRNGDGKFVIENIDPQLCTHAIYAFAKLENNQITVFDPYLDLKENYGLGGYDRFNSLRQKNPNLKTLIAIGGWNEGSEKYSRMAATPQTRATFVKSAVDYCLKYNFSGLDVDWEYPAHRGGAPQDKQNFASLLKELKEAFTPHGLVLSVAVSAGKSTIDTAYDIPGVAKYVDFINVMTYDFHGSWERKTGHNAPLYPMPNATEDEKTLTVDYAIKYWIKNGAPKEKIILGMGTYGRSYTLANAANNGLGAPATGPGTKGPFTAQDGMLGYNEICRDKGWTEVFVQHVDAPYAYKGNQWVGYDNAKSIGLKVDYIIKEGIGGGMIWSLETDDFRGTCGSGKYPLLGTIASKLIGETVIPNTDTIPQPDHITTPGYDFECKKQGYFRDPSDCSVYHYCQSNHGGFARKTLHCPAGLAYSEKIRVCDYKKKVPECRNSLDGK
ncbi:Chitotriosidase-1 like protein [Argiope bruennichi]|uniref:Chitotriosidase-1 like protein n=1 Tax=Argiope bruennichi TaxID=94029 RepID=A0A8T0FE56_ARGBR|nr:Chitotriosidase-1 like protein [Argiope bruennichi]